jgi:hypothetical protein
MNWGNFHLNKWFLDFVGDNGEIIILYAAKLTWHGMVVPYTSILSYAPKDGISEKSRFRNVKMPEKRNGLITWNDSKFEIEGTWESLAVPLHARLFDSDEGFLDWNCFQPASKVSLKINDRVIEGIGYAEQLILTAPPWKIPMNELRWGHFGSNKNQLVWIELRKDKKLQWLWWNGIKINKCTIEDDYIFVPEKNVNLKLDRRIVLESKKKIFSVVKDLLDLIPGFNKIIPLNFLMAQENKWFSKGQLLIDGKTITSGIAIHELVSFKSHEA